MVKNRKAVEENRELWKQYACLMDSTADIDYFDDEARMAAVKGRQKPKGENTDGAARESGVKRG